MNLSINKNVFSRVPDLKIGIIHYTKIVVSPSPQMIRGRFQFFQENLYFELQDVPVTERPGIKEWRTVWKALGADPNRYRLSAESLMRRVAKQNFLSPVHLAVDLNNFFSLQYEIPIGIYDAQCISGNIEINLGTEEIGYEGLNGRYNKLKNILYTKDDMGPFGSPFVDSVRTSVTEGTTEALQIFYLRPSLEESQCRELLTSCGKMFTQVAGGEFRTELLTAENPSITIEGEAMKTIPLAEGIKLKSILTKKVQELIYEIHGNAHVVVEKGETPKQSGRPLAEIEAELAQVRKDIRTLDKLIYRANIDHTIEFKGESMPLVEAIELAKQLRAEANLCKDLGNAEKEKIYTTNGEGAILYEVAMYDPCEYRERAKQLEKDAHRLSNLINAKNYEIHIEFDDSNYF